MSCQDTSRTPGPGQASSETEVPALVSEECAEIEVDWVAKRQMKGGKGRIKLTKEEKMKEFRTNNLVLWFNSIWQISIANQLLARHQEYKSFLITVNLIENEEKENLNELK
jgi:hypothetical protein